MNISPLAYISENAMIGKNVTIGPFVTIDENVVIGDGTIIDSNAVIHSGARIGNNCHIHSGAVVSDIREFVTIHRGTASKGKTVIGDNCLIMAYCHVAHDCILGNNVIMSNTVQLAGEVEVDNWAVIGGGALIHQFTKIGPHVMVQGGTLVNKDIPPYVMVGRYPMSYERVNSIGLHRRGFSNDQINGIQDIYRALYMSGLNTSDALKKVEAELPQSPERDEIVNFVKNSKRGIVRMGI